MKHETLTRFNLSIFDRKLLCEKNGNICESDHERVVVMHGYTAMVEDISKWFIVESSFYTKRYNQNIITQYK